MEAACIDTFGVGVGNAKRPVWPAFRSACVAVLRALAENARDDTLDRSSTDGFAALPRREQNRLLDRGFRP